MKNDLFSIIFWVGVLILTALTLSEFMLGEPTAYQEVCQEMDCKPDELREYCETFGLDPEEVARYGDSWDSYEVYRGQVE